MKINIYNKYIKIIIMKFQILAMSKCQLIIKIIYLYLLVKQVNYKTKQIFFFNLNNYNKKMILVIKILKY